MPAFGSTSYGGGPYAGTPIANSPQVETNQGAFPTRIIEMSFGYGPNDINPVWVNVTSDVTQFSTKRGRQHILARFEAGTATITLDNKSGRYSPFNTTGPYYGNIRPGTPLRIRAVWGAVTYPQFYGFVETWPLTWPSANDSTVNVTAVDTMKFLNLKKATSINYYQTVVGADAPYAWYRANDPLNSTTMADSGSSGTRLAIAYRTNYPFSFDVPQAVIGVNPTFQVPGALIADSDAALDLGEAGAMFWGTLPASIPIASAMSVETWIRTNKAGSATTNYITGVHTNPAGTAAMALTLDQDGNVGLTMGDTTFTTVASTTTVTDNQWHHLVGTSDGTTGTLYVDGFSVVSGPRPTGSGFPIDTVMLGGRIQAGGPSNPTVEYYGVIDEMAVYRSALSAAQVAAHYAAGIVPRVLETTGARITYLASYTGAPTSMQAIDAGQTVVQGATAGWLTNTLLKNMQDQADTENGNLFIDAAGNLTFFDRIHTSRSPYSSVSAVLGDSGTVPEEPYRLGDLSVPYDDVDIVNEVTAAAPGLAPQTVSDATSQGFYGKRTGSLSLLSYYLADVIGRAYFELNLGKASLPRIDSVLVNPADDPTMLFGPVLGFDLLTRVEVRRRPLDGTSSLFDQICLIEGIEHKVTKATWETTWRLSTIDATKVGVFNESNFGEVVFAY